MKNRLKGIIPVLLLVILAAFRLFGSGDTAAVTVIGGPDGPTQVTLSGTDKTSDTKQTIDEDGTYDSKEDVTEYLIAYGHLPSNFITKKQAEAAGWNGGELEDDCPGKCIGGDRFGNREGLLPKAQGRSYTECDINTLGAKTRGAERIVFSNDGLIYYTGDHYESFTLLYGGP